MWVSLIIEKTFHSFIRAENWVNLLWGGATSISDGIFTSTIAWQSISLAISIFMTQKKREINHNSRQNCTLLNEAEWNIIIFIIWKWVSITVGKWCKSPWDRAFKKSFISPSPVLLPGREHVYHYGRMSTSGNQFFECFLITNVAWLNEMRSFCWDVPAA